MNAKQNGMWILRVMTVDSADLSSDDFLFDCRDDVDGFLRTFREEAREEGTDCTNAYWLLGPIMSGMAINEVPKIRLDDNTDKLFRFSTVTQSTATNHKGKL